MADYVNREELIRWLNEQLEFHKDANITREPIEFGAKLTLKSVLQHLEEMDGKGDNDARL